jgi:hypothetical protein
MRNSPPIFLLLAILVGVFGVAIMFAGIRLQPSRSSRAIKLTAVLPALVMLGLFYSLAIHMHHSLGGWPSSIGMHGFPPPLITHAEIASQYFSVLLLICIFLWPVGIALSALIRRWRGALLYLGVFAVSFSLSLGATLLAPSEFLYWWWD